MLSSFLLCLQIREEIEQYGIKIYQFPDCDSDEDEEFKQQDAELKVRTVRLCCLCLMDFLQVDTAFAQNIICLDCNAED